MKDNEEKLKTDDELADFAQGLVSVCFSLWRAVFLSDISDYEHGNVTDAKSFLGNLLLHNMVAYPQDRNMRDWTFEYYVNNARHRLEKISDARNDILPAALVARMLTGHSKDYWEQQHNACVIAVRNFEAILAKISN
jgi:hypothetical protein